MVVDFTVVVVVVVVTDTVEVEVEVEVEVVVELFSSKERGEIGEVTPLGWRGAAWSALDRSPLV